MNSAFDEITRGSVKQLRKFIRRTIERRKRSKIDIADLRQSLCPLFVIGANRSGTSVVSSILSQHPKLEGLFSGARRTHYDPAGHSVGFCESGHVWPHLFPGDRKRKKSRHLPYWGLPQYLSDVYREGVRDSRERDDLLWDVQRLRATSKEPLIKDQFNTLRVGLIADVFMRSRFILVTRDWPGFIERGAHKWRHDGMNTLLDPNTPRAGLHWQLLNTIARYDLETFAPGRYSEIRLDLLHESPESAAESFSEALDAVGLSPFEFDLRELTLEWEREVKSHITDKTLELDVISHIVQFEKHVLDGKGLKGGY